MNVKIENELKHELGTAKTEQNVEQSSNINFSRLVGWVLYCTKRDGKTFMSRLVSVDDKDLWFVSRKGIFIYNNADDILSAVPLKKIEDDFSVEVISDDE